MPEIKLVISQNDSIMQFITEKVDNNNFVKTIENLQVIANATLTKLIDDLGGPGDCMVEEEQEESDPDEDVCTSPKKVKK